MSIIIGQPRRAGAGPRALPVLLAGLLLSAPAQALKAPEPVAAPAPLQRQEDRPEDSDSGARAVSPAPRPRRGSGDTFTPSERIQADSVVSFPVDI